MENLELYNKYKEVPSNALKPFDNGNFKGTDINTMWRIRSLTETFGACGIGWYYDIVRVWTEQGVKDEVMCFAEIKLYIKDGSEWSKPICATGGSKIIQTFKAYTKNNDEGFKMAITDAFGVACKLLGFGADIYWENDTTKYTNQEETKEPKEMLNDDLVAEFLALGGTLELASDYYKTTIEDLTNAHIQNLVDSKKRALENKKQQDQTKASKDV